MSTPRPFVLFGLTLLVAGSSAVAQTPPPADTSATTQWLETQLADLAAMPDVDPEEIINESYNFRKEREPDMTAAEFALYERMSGMVDTNPTFALQLLETMLSDEEEDSAAFDVALGNMYFSHDRIDEALARYHSAVEKYPQFLRAWVNIGMIHYREQQWERAGPAFAKAINLGDRDAQTFGLLGFALRQTGNTLGAEMAFMQAMTAAPEDPNWIGGLLELYFVNERHDHAESLVRELIRLEPDNGKNWMLYASLLVSLGHPLEAATQLEISRKLGVINADGLALLGDLYVQLELIPEAIDAYASLDSGTSAMGTARLISYARSMISHGDLETAESVLGTLQPGTDWETLRPWNFAQAERAIAREEWDACAEAYQNVLNVEPLNPFALLGLGHAQIKLEDLARAEFTFEQALRIPEAEHRASLELANIILRDRRFAEAIDLLERAESLEPAASIRTQIARLRTLIAE